jgi:hypothetical protein
MTFTIPKLSGGAIAVLLAAAACDNPTTVSDHEHATSAAIMQASRLPDLARDVKQVNSRFHSTTQATAAGYTPDSPCVAVPGLGGMGFHWVNHSLVDPVFDPLNPEAILYEPGPNGQLKITGHEYIVINVGQPAPTFDGQPFDVGGSPVPVPHWTLHVWIYKDNPSGLFAPFNPDVICS